MPLPDTARNDRAIGLWLLLCAAMIFVMALIGAITRLTDSGLSIMEWAPLKGALPPLSGAEWERLFALYRQIPEYRIDNAGMTLAEFKTIFWWEYIHRLWGRLIGLVFLLPFLLVPVSKRRIQPGTARAPSSPSSSSAACRARWAGSWWPAALPSAPTSASTGWWRTW